MSRSSLTANNRSVTHVHMCPFDCVIRVESGRCCDHHILVLSKVKLRLIYISLLQSIAVGLERSTVRSQQSSVCHLHWLGYYTVTLWDTRSYASRAIVGRLPDARRGVIRPCPLQLIRVL